MRAPLPFAVCLTLAIAPSATAQVGLGDLARVCRERAERSRPRQVAALEPFLADLALGYQENQLFLDGKIAEAAAIGDGLVPLLLEKLQPASGGEPARNLAGNCRRVLERLDPASFVDALAEMARGNHEIARPEAIRLLGHAGTPQSVLVLTDLLDQTTGEEKRLVVRSLRLLRAAAPATKIVPALGSNDRQLREEVLAYLVAARPRQVVEFVLQALGAERDTRLLPQYVEYFIAAVQEHDGVARGLLWLLDPEKLDWQDRLRLVQGLATIAPKDHEPTTRRMHEILDSGDTTTLAVQAAVTLRALGDRQGVTKLQRTLNDQLRRPQRKREPGLYEQRANLSFAIEDYGDAIADYEKIIEYTEGPAMTRRAWIGIAKSEARRKKTANLLKALKSSGMTVGEIELLGLDDPVVRETLQQDKVRAFLQQLAKDEAPK
ncbi:MAG: hypothetical protein JNL08_01120 [Planctomycetes bacterium]|nr:hypothetical protein [Planctomycetota bacterium]